MDGLIRKTIDSRIMIDAQQFRKSIPNYPRFFTKKSDFEVDHTLLDSFIDVKSTILRDILRDVLDGATSVSLREDRPSINPDVLFTYHTQLDAVHATTKPGSPERLHLGKLIEFLKSHYASASDKLTALVQHMEITFDLLPVFFQPNSIVYMVSSTSENPRCPLFDARKFQIEHGQKRFDMNCRYLTHDGKCFGEATTMAEISEFHGVTKITSSGVYPLDYHPEKQEVVD
ncbi:uncharacterized protein HMPREF1120_08910 [Exophiala dermatitidis NIH/UT8656]|uniref:DUF7025 domain-containing protein n=1 Tax=Exophiala dermatitidis (strain ATCC 34100 / CBS 525.76 / NIH/UT8656) TaxID=858893 RepID=H6CB21_EXODN|nr:uncharacterized protein HMPREF1120_08910 [Exophiala dermatitidis NIH/UT8656]EHY60968.1 hypothetical protein HMPREF1120_08910 [Exophiala dermatitidis NIH/UT8656]